MRVKLEPHPDTPCGADIELDVLVVREQPTTLGLHYFLYGAIGDLKLPDEERPTRKDGLWQHSCFEAFIRVANSPAYHEINLAPSRAWAVYRFDAYREGMGASDALKPVATKSFHRPDTYAFQAIFDTEDEAEFSPEAVWNIGISAVIEEKGGRISYWAPAHPPGKPDFHHPACFVLELPPP